MAKRIGYRGKGVFCFVWVPASAGMTVTCGNDVWFA